MANPLLVRALPEHLAERRQAIELVENVAFFARLAAIVEADLGTLPVARIPPRWRASPVSVGLQFAWADARERLPLLSARLDARIDAVCQRCLEPCELRLTPAARLLLVHGDTPGASAASDYEIWELDEATVQPLEVVEELLIMALPMAATHARPEDCGPLATRVTPVPSDTVRPFADLKARIAKTE